MSYRRLRVFPGPAPSLRIADVPPRTHTVTIPLGDVLALLAEAVRTERVWINDFLDDEITIPSDLYEVLQAFEHYRRPAG